MELLQFIWACRYALWEAAIYSTAIFKLFYTKGNKLLAWLGVFLFTAVLSIGINSLNIPWLAKATTVIFLLSLAVTHLFQTKFENILFYTLAIHFILVAADLLVGWSLSLVLGHNIQEHIINPAVFNFFSILSKVVSSIFVWLVTKYLAPSRLRVPTKYWKMLSVINIVFFCTIAVLANYYTPILVDTYVSYGMFLLLPIVLLYAITMFIFASIAQYHYTENVAITQKRTGEHLQRQIQELDERDSEFRKYHHNWKSNLECMSQMVQSESSGALVEYIHSLLSAMPTVEKRIYCGVPSVDAVLNIQKGACDNQCIELKLDISPIHIDYIEALDMANIISILLDNALEASVKLPEAERKIKFKICRNKNIISLAITNQFDGQLETSNGTIVSSKGGVNHGWGLLVVKDLCQKYHGNLEIHHDGNVFKTKVILQDFPA